MLQIVRRLCVKCHYPALLSGYIIYQSYYTPLLYSLANAYVQPQNRIVKRDYILTLFVYICKALYIVRNIARIFNISFKQFYD